MAVRAHGGWGRVGGRACGRLRALVAVSVSVGLLSTSVPAYPQGLPVETPMSSSSEEPSDADAEGDGGSVTEVVDDPSGATTSVTDEAAAVVEGSPDAVATEPAVVEASSTDGAVPSRDGTAGEEIASLRTATSRTVRNSDGTLTTTVFDRPVHFRDAAGTWRAISARIVEDRTQSGFSLRNEAGPFDVRFAPRSVGALVGYRSTDGRSVSMALRGAAASPAEVAGDTVTYRGVFAGVDLEYEVTPVGVKETMWLADRTARSSFDFELDTDGLAVSAEPREDGSWAVYGAPSTDPLFVLAPPFAVDASSGGTRKVVTDAHATMEVSPSDMGLLVRVAVDPVWLAMPDRQFPVALDPTLTLFAGDDAYFDAACATCRGYRNDDLPVGTDESHIFRSMTGFDLAGIPDGIELKDARLFGYYDGSCIAVSTPSILTTSSTETSASTQTVVCGTEDHVLDLHPATSDWSSTSTSTQQLTTAGRVASATVKATQSPGWVSWQMTSLTRDWLSGATTNHGVQLRRRNEDLLKAGPIFSSLRAGGGLELDVTYGETVTLHPPKLIRSNGARLDWTRYIGFSGDTFASYEIHRDTYGSFVPSSQTLLATITDQDVTTFSDSTAKPSTTFHYKVVVRKGNTTVTAASQAIAVTTMAPAHAKLKLKATVAGDSDATQLTTFTDGAPCVEYGGNPRMQVGVASGATARGLVRFDLRDVPSEAKVVSSTLRLTHEAVAEAVTVEAFPVESDWLEGSGDGTSCTGHGAGWLDRLDGGTRWAADGGDADPVAVGAVSAVAGQPAGRQEIPLVGITQRWLDGGQPNHGVLLRSATEATGADAAIRYVTDDDSSAPTLRPELEIIYVDGNTAVAPTIELPAVGKVLSGSVQLSPVVWDDRRVSRVVYTVPNGSGTTTITATSAPFVATWDTTSATNSSLLCSCDLSMHESLNQPAETQPGSQKVTAVAYDDAGNKSAAAEFWAYVSNAPAATGSITFPSNGQTVTGTVTVTANAGPSDSLKDPAVARVELLVDGRLIATDASSPYALEWDTLATRSFDAPHELSLKVTNTEGVVATTAPITVTVGNTDLTRFQATITSGDLPRHVVTGGTTPETFAVTATVTNTSLYDWNANDVSLRAHWRSSDAQYEVGGYVVGGSVTFTDTVPAGATRTATFEVTPPSITAAREAFTLELDLYDRCVSTYFDHGVQCLGDTFSAKGNKPKSGPAVVEPATGNALGLEQFWHYVGGELGGGAQHLVNVADGNLLARLTPFAAAGRGLNTVVDITYNSNEESSDSQLGRSWSLAISGLVRAGERLHVKEKGAKPTATFIDADGTSHTFTGILNDSNVLVGYQSPPGVHLHLSENESSVTERWTLTRPDRVQFHFNSDGWPTSVVDANGNRLSFAGVDPSGSDDPGDGRGLREITTVRDAGGNEFKLDYYDKSETHHPDIRGKIQTITDRDGSRLEFSYYNHGHLRRVSQRGHQNADRSRVATRDRHWTFTYTTPDLSGPMITDAAARKNPDPNVSNEKGRLYSVVDPRGNETVFAYLTSGKDKGKVRSITDRTDAATTFAYDTAVRTTTVSAPDARTTAYSYDTAGKVTSIVNPGGDTIGVAWTSDFQVERIDEPGGAFTSYTYDDNGGLTSATDGEGNTTRLRYQYHSTLFGDGPGNWEPGRTHGHLSDLVEKVDPNGVATPVEGDYTWKFERDANGNLTGLVDPENHRTTYMVNGDGTVASVTDPTNATTGYPSYNVSGQPTKIVDAESRQTLLHYDIDGLLVGVTEPTHVGVAATVPVAEKQTRFRYDAFHRLVHTSTPKSTVHEPGALVWTTTAYDENDNVTSTTQPAYGRADVPARGPVTTTDYDLMDRPVKVDTPDVDRDQGDNASSHTPETTQIVYDTAGRTAKVIAPKGVATATDPDDYTTTFVYDTLDRVIRTVEANIDNEPGQQRVVGDSATTHYCYDDAGNLVWEVGPNAKVDTVDCAAAKPSHTTVFAYDRAHRPTSVIDAEGHTSSRTFDPNGNVTSVTDANNVTTTVAYDQRNLPLKTTQPLTIDPATGASTRDLVTRREFDPAGRLARLIPPRAYDASPDKQTFNDYVTRYAYDRTGLVTRVDLPTDANTGQYYIHRSYDPAGRLQLVSVPTEQADVAMARSAAPDRFTEVGYYDTGWIRRQDVNLEGPGDPQPPVLFDYHPAGLHASHVVADANGAPDDSTRMRWDYTDGLTLKERVDQGGQRSFYDYDPHGQVVNAVDADGVAEADAEVRQTVLDHDGLGRVVISYERNEPPGTTDAASDWQVTTYAYHPDDTIREREEDIRQPGKDAVVGSGRKRVFTYDQTGRPRTQRDHGKDPVAASDDHLVEFDFDPVGREISRTVKRHTGTDFTLQQATTWDWHANGKLDVLTTKTPTGVTERHDAGYLDLAGIYVNGHRTVDDFVLATPGGSAPCPPGGPGCKATYRYDALERLTFATDGHGGSSTYTLDPAGNATRIVRDPSGAAGDETVTTQTYAGQQTLTLTTQEGGAAPVSFAYFYDRRGELDCVTLEGGTAGDCLTAASGHPGGASSKLVASYGWDYLDRIETIKRYQPMAGAPARIDTVADYRHDALDRLAEQSTVRHDTTTDAATVTDDDRVEYDYLSTTPLVLDERHFDGATTDPTKTRSYLFNGVGQRLGMTETKAGTTKAYTYAYDVHGSTSQLISASGGDAGTVTATYGYDPYGKEDPELTVGDNPDDPINVWRYTGKRLDPATGNLDMGARHFSPDTTRFLQDDALAGAMANLSLSTDPLTGNRYGLAAGNPISFVEVDGHQLSVDGMGMARVHADAGTGYDGSGRLVGSTRGRPSSGGRGGDPAGWVGPIGDILDEAGRDIFEHIDEGFERVGDLARWLGFDGSWFYDRGESIDDICELACKAAGKALGRSALFLDPVLQWKKDDGRSDLNGLERVLRTGFRWGASSALSAGGALAGAQCGPMVAVCVPVGIVGGGMAGEAGADASLRFLDRTDANLPNLPDLPNLPNLPDLPGRLPDLPNLPNLPNLPDLPNLRNPFDVFG